MDELEYKYQIEIKHTPIKQKLPQDIKKELKAAGMMDEKGKLKLKGISPKMLKRMKQEYVECPVLDEDIQFIQCFVCANFQSRVTGSVLCKGDPLHKVQPKEEFSDAEIGVVYSGPPNQVPPKEEFSDAEIGVVYSGPPNQVPPKEEFSDAEIGVVYSGPPIRHIHVEKEERHSGPPIRHIHVEERKKDEDNATHEESQTTQDD